MQSDSVHIHLVIPITGKVHTAAGTVSQVTLVGSTSAYGKGRRHCKHMHSVFVVILVSETPPI
jgi:hypothetical protein